MAVSKTSAAAVPEAYPRIWAVVAAIPAGSVLGYGEVARRAGLARRARLVSKALNAAPAKLKLPWHRVLRSDGRIAFPAGSESFRRQARLLEREGVSVVNGRVRAPRDVAVADLDDWLWRR